MLYYSSKKKIVCAFYLIYFFFYAVTPLSFNSVKMSLAGGTDPYINNFRLLIIELIGSSISHQQDNNGNRPAIRFLLMKKRAILPDNEPLKTSADQNQAFLRDKIIIPSSYTSIFPDLLSKSIYNHCLYALHAGLSPPPI